MNTIFLQLLTTKKELILPWERKD